MANVESLTSYHPTSGDSIFVDTNVWLMLSFSPLNNQDKVRSAAYGSFVTICHNRGANLCYSQLTLAEIAHSIEKFYYELYVGLNPWISKKSYRALPTERALVINEYEAICNQIELLGNLTGLTLDANSVARCAAIFADSLLDGYDLLHVEAVRSSRLSAILTDDRDFETVHDLIVITR